MFSRWRECLETTLLFSLDPFRQSLSINIPISVKTNKPVSICVSSQLHVSTNPPVNMQYMCHHNYMYQPTHLSTCSCWANILQSFPLDVGGSSTEQSSPLSADGNLFDEIIICDVITNGLRLPWLNRWRDWRSCHLALVQLPVKQIRM